MNALDRIADADAIRRLAERDASLFAATAQERMPVAQRLGWTDLAAKAGARLPLLDNLAAAMRAEGVTDVVLLGMGGSSLASLVISRVIGPAPGAPTLHVLDTTSPVAVRRLLDALTPERTHVLLASKSGTTIEPLTLYAIMREWMDAAVGRPQAGRHFTAITDPGSPLERLRQHDHLRLALAAPATVGGRYSALSMFGLAPAALIGVDMPRLIEPAAAMETACHETSAANPAAQLAAWLADAAGAGRDKLMLVCSPPLRPLCLWIEQLVAESLGKDGHGIVPVIVCEDPDAAALGPDRAVVVLHEAGDGALPARARQAAGDAPLLAIELADVYGLGAEFVRWEHAVALAGFLLGVDPFDEPNVAESKQATLQMLDGSLTPPRAAADLDGTWVTYAGALEAPATPPASRAEALRALLGGLRPDGYLALLAYLPEDDALLAPLHRAAAAMARATRRAVCVELGPRYLHSTGQLHKGGPDTGAFLMITARDRTDIEVPGEPYTLAALHRAQAEGDLVTLAAHGRRVLRLDLPDLAPATLASLAEDIKTAASTAVR